MTIHTEAVQFKADQKLLVFIEKKLQKLEQFYGHIINTKVVLKLENSGKVKDKVVEVRLHIPGNTIVAKETHKTFEGSVEKIVETLKRQINRYKGKRRAIRQRRR